MKLTVESLAKKIEQDNEMFEKATKAEKRVIVAQDCLDRIPLKQITPYSGRFCDISYSLQETTEEKSVKKVLDKINIPICKSCAKGSLFMSYIGRVNNFNFDKIESSNDKDSKEHLKIREIFTLNQLSLIETVYEGMQHIYLDEKNKYFDFSKYESKILNFREKCFENLDDIEDPDKKLLIAICNNIIENKGTFKL